jgi:hypothetical protein
LFSLLERVKGLQIIITATLCSLSHNCKIMHYIVVNVKDYFNVLRRKFLVGEIFFGSEKLREIKP